MKLSNKLHSPVEIGIENTITSSVNRVKLPVVHIDGRLECNHDVSQFCKKASKKLHALSRYVNLSIKINE